MGTAAQRTFVVIDAENILAPWRSAPRMARQAALQLLLGRMEGTWTGIATVADSKLRRDIAFTYPPDRLLVRGVRPGPDAADADLLERIRRATPSSADRMVVFSGDHAFAAAAPLARRMGLGISYFGIRGHIHHRLWRVADEVVSIDPRTFGSTALTRAA